MTDEIPLDSVPIEALFMPLESDRPRYLALPTEAARKIISTTPQRIVGEMDIVRLMPYPAEYDSPNERLAIETLALCCDVLAIASQATREQYFFDGKTRHHFPDILIQVGDDQQHLIEVKKLTSFLKGNAAEKYSAIGGQLNKEKRCYSFLTDDQLSVQPRLNSVVLLARYLLEKVPDATVALVKAQLSDSPLGICMLIKCGEGSFGLAEIYCMLANRQLAFDWGKPLGQATQVSLPGKPFEGLTYVEVLCSGRHHHFLEQLALGRKPTREQSVAVAATRGRAISIGSPLENVGGFPARRRGRCFKVQEPTIGEVDRTRGGNACEPVTADSDSTARG